MRSPERDPETGSAPVPESQQGAHSPRGRAIGIAAVILMGGNLLGSLLGFARQAVIAGVFGDTSRTDAFITASIVPQMFYDLVIGAAVSAALIPTLTEIVERRGREDLWQVVGEVLSLLWVILAVLVGALILFANPMMHLILWAYRSEVKADTIQLAISIVRVLVLTLFFLGTSAVLTAALYSLRRFTAPAFAPSWYHVGVIGGALLGARTLGVMALPVGAVVGALLQALTLVVAIARSRPHFRFTLALTPDTRRIARLYAPVALGLLVSMVGQIVDVAFKANQGESVIAAMYFATTLTQFPIGIAVAALSFAILPSISSDVAFERLDRYKDTLAQGIRLVLFLTIPAAVGYIALAAPIVSLLFQHGHYHHRGTAEAATALAGYAVQIPFVGLDQMLIFAFYARKDTRTPMLIGVLGVMIYIVTALLLAPRFHILGLALANTLQNSLHAVILLGLLIASIGWLRGRGIIGSVTRSLMAGLVMGVAAAGTAAAIHGRVDTTALWGQILQAVPPLIVSGALYLAVSALLRSPELALAWRIARRPRARALTDS